MLTKSEKERERASAISAVLTIVADELNAILREDEVSFTKRTQRETFHALYDNLLHRAKDYAEQAQPPAPKGNVRVL